MTSRVRLAASRIQFELRSPMFFAILSTVGIAIVVAVVLSLTCCTFVMIGDGYAAIVERLGVFNRVLTPGLHLLLPLIERVRRVNWRYREDLGDGEKLTIFRDYRIPLMERQFDPPETKAITKDRVKIFIDVSVHYAIADPKKAVYQIEDLYSSMETLIETSVRSVVSHITLDSAVEGAESIERSICEELAKVEGEWGVKVRRIHVQNLRTTDALMEATEGMVRAEREARARFTREKAEADAMASKAESARRIAEIEWETEGARTRAETARRRDEIEGRAAAEARALELQAQAEAAAAGMRARAEADRVKAMLEAGVGPDFLSERQRVAAFEAFARSEHRGDMLVPYEYAKVFGGPVTLRKNV